MALDRDVSMNLSFSSNGPTVLDKHRSLLNTPTFLEMIPTFIKMSSVLFETAQYVPRAPVSFQHLTGYIEQIARSIIDSVLDGSQDVLESSGGLWNLGRFM
jgi:hypothetical protein